MTASILLDIILSCLLLVGHARVGRVLRPVDRLDAMRQARLLMRFKFYRGFSYPLCVALVGAMACALLSMDMLFAGLIVLTMGLSNVIRLHRLSDRVLI